MNADHEEDRSSTSDELNVFAVGEGSTAPLRAEVLINDRKIVMDVDTGAAVLIISENTLKSVLPRATIQPSDAVLTTYTDERMQVLGELNVSMTHNQQEETLPLIVVAGDGPSLLRRNWMKHIWLDWKKIGVVSSQSKTLLLLRTILKERGEVFKDEIGTIRAFPARLQIREQAWPKFFKPGPVPFTIHDAIGRELDQLESSGILKKVSYSEWAMPIVAVPKKDRHFRICGDYKVTANQALDIDQYPLPKPDDLFSTLAGGIKFSKLDLSQVYQHWSWRKTQPNTWPSIPTRDCMSTCVYRMVWHLRQRFFKR